MPLMSVISHAALPAPGVSVRDEGSAVAGFYYTLICEVTIPPFSDTITVSVPVVTWTYTSVGTQRTFGNSIRLTFTPVNSDDEGVYTCTAHYLADGIASPQGNDSHEVSVSKSLCFCILRGLQHILHGFYSKICPLHRS